MRLFTWFNLRALLGSSSPVCPVIVDFVQFYSHLGPDLVHFLSSSSLDLVQRINFISNGQKLDKNWIISGPRFD